MTPATTPAAEPSPGHREKLLTIGMATYDDYDGVYFTVQALRLYHPEVARDITILVLDNNPGGPASHALTELADATGFQYVTEGRRQGTAVRDRIFREADTPWVMSIDCHVMFVPGALSLFLDYAAANPDSGNLLQGPLLDDALTTPSTHFEPVWHNWMYGQWGTDDRGYNPQAAPFEIGMQGLGVFACRKAAWPGFNPRFRGFGGEEGYIHEKFRQRGHRTLCLPFLRWMHRFARPHGAAYPNSTDDRLRNHLLGWRELGLDTAPLEDYFASQLTNEAVAAMRKAIELEETYDAAS